VTTNNKQAFDLTKDLDPTGTYIGRVWDPSAAGPSVVVVRDGQLFDITTKDAPLVHDILEKDDPAGFVQTQVGKSLGRIEEIGGNHGGGADAVHLLAPCDIQSIKAAGVTFVKSMVERVIEESAAGDPAKADAVRKRVTALIGDSLHDISPGSEKAATLKKAFIEEGIWSQYLEVGIGPDVEVFSKSQTLSSVGWGAEVGLHPKSVWNNPEPEIVLAIDSKGTIKGAALGNDVNLRDFEGRSALLLSKAKDNNASCSIGPFIRLFDEGFTLDNVRNAELNMQISGEDGYELTGYSSMKEISRDPLDIVSQTIGRHHQYPDGFMLFLGTLFAPTEDRDAPGEGFTHKVGDVVTISSEGLGQLSNTVRLSTKCPEWTFGIAALMRNLQSRNLL
jgi:fumarylacetoacetate (FAA) hydrolase family protein